MTIINVFNKKKMNECNLLHVYNWIQFFVSMYNSVTTTVSNDFNFEFRRAMVYHNKLFYRKKLKKYYLL